MKKNPFCSRLADLLRRLPGFFVKMVRLGPRWWPTALAGLVHPVLTRWPSPRPCSLGGFRFRLGTSDLWAWVNVVSEADDRLLREVLGRVAHVVDGGANLGAFTFWCQVLAGKRASAIRWTAVEMSGENAALLQSQPFPHAVDIRVRALAPNAGTVRWMAGTNMASHSIQGADEVGFVQASPEMAGCGATVETLTLEEIALPGTFLKLDIEGAEYPLLEREVPGGIDYMLVEFHVYRRKSPPTPRQLVPGGHWHHLATDIMGGESWFWARRLDPALTVCLRNYPAG